MLGRRQAFSIAQKEQIRAEGGEGTIFVGDDWAEAHHDVCLMDESGRVPRRYKQTVLGRYPSPRRGGEALFAYRMGYTAPHDDDITRG